MATTNTTQAKTDSGNVRARAQPRSFFNNDFPFLRTVTIELFISVAIAGLLFMSTVFILNKQTAKQMQAQEKRNAANAQLREAETEQQEVQNFQPEYKKMRAQGLIGKEDRLHWIEGMKQIQESRKLLPISFDIAPQQTVAVDAGAQTGSLALYATKMSLNLGLLHEIDMLHFLKDIQQIGLYAPMSCTITPTSAYQSNDLSAKLNAQCVLHWLTVGPSQAANSAEGQVDPASTPNP